MKKVEAFSSDGMALCGSFTNIARAMAKSNHIQVVPTGLGARTDGQIVYIPFTSDLLPKHLRQILHGKLDHEVQHVIEERRAADLGRPTPLALMAAEPNPTVKMLFNVWEDARIERNASRRHPGVAENLKANRSYNMDAIKANPKGWGKFWHRLGCALLFAATKDDYSFYDLQTQTYVAELMDLVSEGRKTRWPEQCMDLARKTYERVKELRDKAAAPPPPKKPKGEAAGSGSGSGDSEPTSPSPEDEEEDPKDEEARRTLADTDLSDADYEDLGSAGAEHFESEVRDEAKRHKHYIPDPNIKAHDLFIVPPSTADDDKYVQQVRAEMSSVSGALRTKMRLALQSRARRRVVSGLEAGHLDDGLLTEVRMGNRHIFNDVFEGEGVDTAIEHLIDLSGSMGGNRPPSDPSWRPAAAYYAMRASIILADAWYTLNIPNEFMGFNNNDCRLYPRTASDSAYQLRSPFDYYMFKTWEERFPRVRARFGQIYGRNQNTDGEAVWTAAQRLAQRRARRKILVVISDGDPCDHGDNAMLCKHLKQVITTITRSGIEVIGVGAGTTAPAHFYNESTGAENLIVLDIPKLPMDLFKVMYKKVLQRRAS